MKYAFYTNESTNFLSGYKPGDRLKLAYKGELGDLQAQDLKHACESLFFIFNMEHPVDYRGRSMSVGDVVMFDCEEANCPETGGKTALVRAFSCEGCGFTEVTKVVL